MDEKQKQVLLITSGIFHPPLLGRMALSQTLLSVEGFAFQHLSSLEHLPENLTHTAALVIYFHQKRISPRALSALDRFVADGGGLLAIHSATASFKDTRHYFEILGGRFTGHGAVASMRVTAESGNPDGPFAGIGPFTLMDELYFHELQPGIQIHFSAKTDGVKAPLVWTFSYGRGRVCYAAPGHTSASMNHTAVQEILRRGLLWVADGVGTFHEKA